MEWIAPAEVSVSSELQRVVGGHPLVAEILARRGITDAKEAQAFLDPTYYQPTSPSELPDVDIASQHLLEAIKADRKILVWGDFDVDGQTSTSLLVDALTALGANVVYQVPHRMKHGHGVDVSLLQEYLNQGVELVLTCDTGIAAHAAVQAAKQAGVTMLVTDHHKLPPELPHADALVNPQRLPEGHPLRDLPGVGVTFKLVQRLYELAGKSGEEKHLLDLVALGIVSDVATQRHDTRYLLQLGIDRLRQPQRVGLQALMEAAQVQVDTLSADTIGFQVGPRLNALGRLDDATRAVELLTTDNPLFARQIAATLEVLNNDRKQIEDQIYKAAQDQIAKDPALANDFEAVVLVGERWHPGVIGIVASRIVEQYNKPAVLLATRADDPLARGSARSVPGVDIGASIAATAHLLASHGGHAGAAGCALDKDFVPQFRRQLSNTIHETRDREVVVGLPIDAEVALGGLSMELAEDLDRLAPFGAGNPPIRLMTSELRVVSDAVFGVGNKHRRVTVEDMEGVSYVVTWWRGAEHPKLPDVIDLVYIPRINDYKGRRSLQLEWVAYRPTPGIAVKVEPEIALVDLRHATDALTRIGETVSVWVEGMAADESPFAPERVATRYAPVRGAELAIWTTPPGPQEVTQMMDLSHAHIFYVVCAHTPDDLAEGFLKRLTGLIKYAQRVHDGQVSILQLAAATAQREATVRHGLDWMVAKGHISVEWQTADQATIKAGGKPADSHALSQIQDSLQALLSETAAFRAYFRQARLETFFGL